MRVTRWTLAHARNDQLFERHAQAIAQPYQPVAQTFVVSFNANRSAGHFELPHRREGQRRRQRPPTAGGNIALAGTYPPHDATVIAKLRSTRDRFQVTVQQEPTAGTLGA